jgi:hypothetical protein
MNSLISLFSLLMALIILCPAYGQASDQSPFLLPNGAEVRVDKNKKIIEYCPDNTCNIISAPASVNKVALEDFAVLYFSYASGYIYLGGSFDGKAPYRLRSQEKVKEIVSRQRSGCKGSELAVISCIMLRLVGQEQIKIAFSRFDEGEEAVGPEEPQEILSEKRLREVQAWYQNQK